VIRNTGLAGNAEVPEAVLGRAGDVAPTALKRLGYIIRGERAGD
jgi:hypothetical protein